MQKEMADILKGIRDGHLPQISRLETVRMTLLLLSAVINAACQPHAKYLR